MKVLVLIVSIVAGLTVDDRNPPNCRDPPCPMGPEWRYLADGGDQQLNDEKLFTADEIQDDLDSFDVNQGGREKEEGHSEIKLRGGSKCKANIACTILGGSCVVNATLCGGRLVLDGCKGKKCQCCIPETVNNCVVDDGENSTLWQKVNTAKAAIQELISEGNYNFTRAIQKGLQNLTIELESIKDNQEIAINNFTNFNSKLELKLNNMTIHQEMVNNCVADDGENSTLWQKVNTAEAAIQTIVSEGNYNVTRDMEMGLQNLTINIKSIKDNQDIAMNNLTNATLRLELKLNNMMFRQGCPEGFFTPTDYSTQCFKLLNDSEISWTAANAKCHSLGLVLAKPHDAVSLRRYIMERYGLGDEIWVGARGTGSTFQWQLDSKYLRTSNPLMYYSSSSYYSTSNCLAMATTESQWSSYPTKPYKPQSCAISEYPLCELVMPTGCPDGFFMPTGSKQCFKLFLDAEISWSSARTKCYSEGLVLAKPHDAIFVRSYIMQRYGLNDEIWVDAVGTGSSFQWQRDSKYLRTSNPLMYSTSSSLYTTSYCLALATSDGQWNSYPTKPYMPVSCGTSEYPLCELIMQ